MVRRVVPDTETAGKLCAIENAAFPERAVHWTQADYLALADPKGTAVIADDHVADGLLILRFAADEGEILDLGVVPAARRRGLARALVAEGEILARRQGITRLFLEVAADNTPAWALYRSAGFTEDGLRPNYYARPDGTRMDAIVMIKPLSALA